MLAHHSLFQYLEAEGIVLDKKEFLFQVQCHPNYPSVLAISDTLAFFNVNNAAISLAGEDLEHLPSRFMALLEEINSKPTLDTQLYYIEQRNERYFCTGMGKTEEIMFSDLQRRWQNVVILAEKSDDGTSATNMRPLRKFTFIISFLVFFISVVFFDSVWQNKLFVLFPFVGIFLSVAALKDLFGVKSTLIDGFCNLTSASNCSVVVSSNRWQIFNMLSFSDLSIVFFGGQLVAAYVFMVGVNPNLFFGIQKILLFAALPIILLSIYYQKFVEKKWCPICLAIIVLILTELLYVNWLGYAVTAINATWLFTFGGLNLLILCVWLALKGMFTQLKELKEFRLKANRFMRNYDIFRQILLTKPKTELIPNGAVILGDEAGKTVITLITNPFCSYCKDAHEVLESLLDNYNIKLQIIIRVDFTQQDDDVKLFYRSLLSIYFNQGQIAFKDALNNWFADKNLTDWLENYSVSTIDMEMIDAVYNKNLEWCIKNDYNYTPAILVNGYLYPNEYEKEMLPFFINELVEDDF